MANNEITEKEEKKIKKMIDDLVEKAKKMFCIYKRCRSTFLNKIRKGYTLAEVLQAS